MSPELRKDKPSKTLQRERAHLSICLQGLANDVALDLPPDSYKTWTDRVSRYSFRGLEDNLTHLDFLKQEGQQN